MKQTSDESGIKAPSMWSGHCLLFIFMGKKRRRTLLALRRKHKACVPLMLGLKLPFFSSKFTKITSCSFLFFLIETDRYSPGASLLLVGAAKCVTMNRQQKVQFALIPPCVCNIFLLFCLCRKVSYNTHWKRLVAQNRNDPDLLKKQTTSRSTERNTPQLMSWDLKNPALFRFHWTQQRPSGQCSDLGDIERTESVPYLNQQNIC